MTRSDYKNILIEVASKKYGEEAGLQSKLNSIFFEKLAKAEGCDVHHCTGKDNSKGRPDFRSKSSHVLKFSSISDFVISKDSGQILAEIKRLTWVDPSREAFSGKGAKQLWDRCQKDEIEAIYEWCDKFHEDESKKGKTIPLNSATMPNVVSVVPDWYDSKKDQITHPAYDAGIMFTLTFNKGPEVKLYQLDSYLLDLYYGNCKYVIWTNGLVWKIFSIENGTLKCEEFHPAKIHFDKNDYDYIPPLSKDDPSRIANPSEEVSKDASAYGEFVKQHIQIDQNEFNALIDYLDSILSTL